MSVYVCMHVEGRGQVAAVAAVANIYTSADGERKAQRDSVISFGMPFASAEWRRRSLLY